MSRKTQGRIRTLFAVPSAALLVFGATELLASPPAAARAPDCSTYCEESGDTCTVNPWSWYCVYCGCV